MVTTATLAADTGTAATTHAHLARLVDRVAEAVADPVYAARKEMWTRHNRLEKVPKAPVCVFLGGGYSVAWQELIPPDELVATEPLARSIELQLRQKLFVHDHIPDDEALLPTIWVSPVRPRRQGNLWGISTQRRRTDDPRGAYKVEPVVADEADLARLSPPRYEVDGDATRALLERATELVRGRLPVKLATDELAASPSETVVSLMGIEAVLYGVVDRPEFIHRMMDFVTDGYLAYHRQREAAGGVDAEATWRSRVHYEQLPPPADPHRLASSWAYVSAQSLCGLSPAMYD
jgi:hypothetical protein